MQVKARSRIPASGIHYAPGLVLTAAHVVEVEENIPVAFDDGTQAAARLKGRDAATDIAVLELDAPHGEAAEPAVGEPRVGELVLALGRPSGGGIEASQGVISAVGGPVHTGGRLLERYIRSDTILYPGFSGGPMVSASGLVVGMNTSGISTGLAVTIPTPLAWRVADLLNTHGRVPRAYLGVRSQPVELPPGAAAALQQAQKEGLLVIGVESGSPAERGGLLAGDILLAIGSAPVPDHAALYTQLSGPLAGRTETVQILRGGQPDCLVVEFNEI